MIAWPEKELPEGQPPPTLTVNGVIPGDETPKLDLQEPVVIKLVRPDGIPPVESTKATLTLLGRSVFTAEAPIEPTPDGAITMSYDLSAARFVAAGPTDLAITAVTQGTAEDQKLAEARIRTKQPLLTAPTIGAILLGLYASSLWRRRRGLARRKKRSIGSILGAAVLAVVLVASFAVLVWGVFGRVPQPAGVGVAFVLGALGGLGIAIGGVRRGRRRRAERAQARAAARG